MHPHHILFYQGIPLEQQVRMSFGDTIPRYFQNKLLSNKKFNILHSSIYHKNKLTMTKRNAQPEKGI